MKLEILLFLFAIALSIVVAFIVFLFMPVYFVLDFTLGFLAVFLGLIIGFAIDRLVDAYKKTQDKKDLLHALHIELETIKETAIIERIYPDIWESAISSGKLSNLLNSKQIIKLTKIYKSVRELDNERGWVKQAEESYHSSKGLDKDLYKIWQDKKLTHKIHTENLNQMIEKILQDKELWGDSGIRLTSN